MSAGFDVLATDGIKVLGTIGFFVPAAILVTLVVVAVIRDRRRVAREEAEEAAEQARARESLGDHEGLQGRPTPPPGH